MTQEEKFNLLTVDDLKKIDSIIYRISDGHIWARLSSQFWEDVLNELQKEK